MGNPVPPPEIIDGILMWKPETPAGYEAAFVSRVALDPTGPSFADYGLAGDREKVIAARKRLCSALGVSFDMLTIGEQVHEATVTRVTQELAGSGNESPDTRVTRSDSMVTDIAGLPLAVMTADCAPVLMINPAKGAVASVHAGWRSAVAGILENAVNTMCREFGGSPGEVLCYIGPCIGPCCFEVKEDLTGELEPAEKQAVVEVKEQGMFMDLRKLCYRRLESVGVAPEKISMIPVCTCCHTELMHSYRGDKKMNGSNISLVFRI